MKKDKTMPTEVRDRPAEIWIKILSLIAVITLPLIGIIGSSLIDGQERMNKELSRMNGFLQTHESRISRNELDIRAWGDISSENSSRLSKMEGRK
jgi:hypothetical protein